MKRKDKSTVQSAKKDLENIGTSLYKYKRINDARCTFMSYATMIYVVIK